MKVEIKKHDDAWTDVKDLALATIGREGGKYPSSEWKTRILYAEHSPIRQQVYTIRFYDLPYWIAMHFARHKVGVEHYVSTQRGDRTGEDRDGKRQDAPVMYTMVANAQAIINISRKRLCSCAHPETRKAWLDALEGIREVDPELADVCVPECVYRGFCPEFTSCGMDDTLSFAELRSAYVLKCKEARK